MDVSFWRRDKSEIGCLMVNFFFSWLYVVGREIIQMGVEWWKNLEREQYWADDMSEYRKVTDNLFNCCWLVFEEGEDADGDADDDDDGRDRFDDEGVGDLLVWRWEALREEI